MDFNKQANVYDEKVKLPSFLPTAIANSVLQQIPAAHGKTLLDVGVGTGEISVEIAKLPFTYTGFDMSSGMINIFLNRYSSQEATPNIIVADGNLQWPAADGSIDVLFSSKALHLLNTDHTLREIDRIKGPNGLFLFIGSVQKDPNGVDGQMRKKMLQLLENIGIKGKGGNKQRQQFYQKCIDKGASLLPTASVGKWNVSHAPVHSLNSWKKVDGLAGNKLNETDKTELLTQLEDWAHNKFGDLSKEVISYRDYQLSGVLFKEN